MAHEIDMTTGVAAAAFARVGAWHGLGRVIPDFFTAEEAIEHAGLNWDVEVTPLFRYAPDGKLHQEVAHRAAVRQDTQATLGIVGGTWQPYQNRGFAKFLQAVVGAGAKIESAGSLYGGKKIWFLCNMQASFDAMPGDEVKTYALFANGHDGRTMGRVLPTGVRVVCANTFNMALDDDNLGMTFRHDGRLSESILEAQRALGLTRSRAERMEEEAHALVRVQMREASLAKFFVSQVEKLRFSQERAELVLQQLAELHESPTNTLPGMRGTAWGAYNAWSEWVDHAPRRTGKDARLESIWMGEGSRQKRAAWNEALALV